MKSTVLMLDVNETLSDWSRCGTVVAAGLPGDSLDAWFAATLRDGFALTAAGSYADFRMVGADVLAASCWPARGSTPPRTTISGVLSGFANCSVRPDVAPGLRRSRTRRTDHHPDQRARRRCPSVSSPRRHHAAARAPTRRAEPQRWKPHPDAYRTPLRSAASRWSGWRWPRCTRGTSTVPGGPGCRGSTSTGGARRTRRHFLRRDLVVPDLRALAKACRV